VVGHIVMLSMYSFLSSTKHFIHADDNEDRGDTLPPQTIAPAFIQSTEPSMFKCTINAIANQYVCSQSGQEIGSPA